jgi:predicted DCC family thiol-disulfide oxidoreductase YuxK
MATATVKQPAADSLPSPNQRPGTDVVVYDGQCPICTAQVRKLVWWDCQRKLSYLSLHDYEVYRRWPDLPCERLMEEMVVIDRRGRRHWGPDAIRYLSRRLRRLWWAAPVLHFPGSMYVWRPLYRWVARNRYRLSGGDPCDDGTCSLHRHDG